MIKSFPLSRFLLPGLLLLVLAGCSQQPEVEVDRDQLQVNAHLDLGELYRQQGQYRAAQIEGLNAMRLKPSGFDTRSFMANLFADMGDLGNALNFVATLYAANPKDPDTALLAADLEYRAGNAFRAESILGQLGDLEGEYASRKQLILGNIYALREDFEGAREVFEPMLENDPDFIDGLIAMSRLEVSQGNLGRAEAYIEQAATNAPGNLDLLIWRGQFAMLTGNLPVAEEVLFDALDAMADYDTMTSKRFQVMQNLQATLQYQGKNDEALTYAELISDTPQGQYLEQYQEAIGLYQRGGFDEAEAAAENLLQINPNDVNSQSLVGLARYARGDYESAREVLSSLVETRSATPRVIKTLAALNLRQGQSALAIDTLSSALNDAPDDPSLLAMLGLSYQSAGDFARAEEFFQQALDLAPEDGQLLYSLAQVQYLQGNFADSRTTLITLTDQNPGFASAKASLIGIYLAEEDFDGARDQVQLWLDRQANSSLNTLLAGWVAMAEEDLPEARRLLETTLGIDPDIIQAQLLLSRIHLVSEDYEAARQQYANVLSLAPSNSEGIAGLLATGALDDAVTEAVAIIEDLIEQDPTNYNAALLLSRFYLRQGILDESLRWAEFAWEVEENEETRTILVENYAARVANSDVELADAAATSLPMETIAENRSEVLEAMRGLAIQAIAAERYEEGASIVRRIQETFPEDNAGLILEGDLSFEQGDLASAVTFYERAWQMGLDSASGSKTYFSLIDLDRTAEAREFLDNWIAEVPDDGVANTILGTEFLANGDEPQALRHLEVAYEQEPSNPIVLNNLAWLYRDSDIERGINLARQAVANTEGYADALDTLGWLLHLNGENEEARGYLQQALVLVPNSPAIREHLATVDEALN